MSRYALILASSAAAILVVLAVPQARGDSMNDVTDLDPHPADPQSVCTASRSFGGLTSCKSTLLWHEYANQDCIVRGYPKVGAIDYVGVCWKGFRSVEFTCCN
jgi:hypothetical protein